MNNIIKNILLLFIIYYFAFIIFTIVMFIVGNYKFCKFLKDIKRERILLVGNGPSALKNKKKNIDKKYSVIIRFNNFKTKGYEEYVGSKTDYVVTAGRLPAENFNSENFCFFNIIHILTYPIVFLIYKFSFKKHLDLNLYSFDFKKNYFVFSKFVTKSLNNFTSGFSIIKILLDNKIKFDYTGFDSLSDSKNEKLKYCHYYKDDHNMIYYINKFHNSDLEKELFKSHKNLNYCKDIS